MQEIPHIPCFMLGVQPPLGREGIMIINHSDAIWPSFSFCQHAEY